jgi:putative FmdB family regulatory protein
MPTYDYACQACGHEFEEFQSMSAKPLKKCPACGRMKLKRLIGTGAGIIFKGSGFYETDYRSDSYRKSAEAEKKGDSADKSDSTKSDAKSDGGEKTTDKSEKTSGTDKASKTEGKSAEAPKPKGKDSGPGKGKSKSD